MSSLSQTLTKRFAEEPDLDVDTAQRLAESALDNEAVAQAAARWIETGEMPGDPVVAGISPATLAEDYYPSQVFNFLAWLISDPSQKSMLEEIPKKGSAVYTVPGTLS